MKLDHMERDLIQSRSLQYYVEAGTCVDQLLCCGDPIFCGTPGMHCICVKLLYCYCSVQVGSAPLLQM